MDTVTIFEDWNEVDGQIWYRWRLANEKEWHYKLTAYKEKPVIQYKILPLEEYKLLGQPKDER